MIWNWLTQAAGPVLLFLFFAIPLYSCFQNWTERSDRAPSASSAPVPPPGPGSRKPRRQFYDQDREPGRSVPLVRFPVSAPLPDAPAARQDDAVA